MDCFFAWEISMTARTSMLHIRVDEQLKADASDTLASVGLSLSEAVRIFLTRVTKEGGLPAGLASNPDAHDDWFRAKVPGKMTDFEVNYMNVSFPFHSLFCLKCNSVTMPVSGLQAGWVIGCLSFYLWSPISTMYHVTPGPVLGPARQIWHNLSV